MQTRTQGGQVHHCIGASASSTPGNMYLDLVDVYKRQHLFDPKDIDECIAMVDECGYTNWTFLACTVIDSPFALAQNLLCAQMCIRDRFYPN